MITKQVIDSVYRKYRKLPKSTDCLDFGLLFDGVAQLHGIVIDAEADELVIDSLGTNSPFHRILLSRVHAIVPFDEWVAIVFHSSIVFLNKKSAKASIHLKPHRPGLWERLRRLFSR